MQATKRWQVSELTKYIRQMFDMDYRLQEIEVEGEVSNWRVYDSGHAYFTLKDADSQLKGIMWASDVINLTSRPRDGDRVVARGRLSVYETRGEYQLYAHAITAAGVGDLAAQFERLKAQLQAEGLFDEDRKRPLPDLIRRIGIVTSPGAAALQDVRNVLSRRNPLAKAILSPTLVQGSDAPPQIVAALDALNRYGEIDVILMVRGGGSLEDLWCFNDERVVRAVAESRIPIVSGVGHEVDFTLVDFAADLRAPTPSAAAELVTPITIDDHKERLERIARNLTDMVQGELIQKEQRALQLAGSLRLLAPQSKLDAARQRIDTMWARIGRAVEADLTLRRERLAGRSDSIQTMNPTATLSRGYAIVRGESGEVLRRADDAAAGTRIDVRLSEGSLKARVEDTDPTS